MVSQGVLYGKTICLVFEYALSHYSRLLDEINLLEDQGAKIILLTSTKQAMSVQVPASVTPRTKTPVEPRQHANRIARIIHNKTHQFVSRLRNGPNILSISPLRQQELQALVQTVDAFWVIDYLSLPSTMAAAQLAHIPVIYETVDLVPEYPYWGKRIQRKMLKGERDIINQLSGFITAADSYAQYYQNEYVPTILANPPVVRDNMPNYTVNAPSKTTKPLKFLFFGSLMFDRPIKELLQAVSYSTEAFTLTFQGKNLLGDAPFLWAQELNVTDRVVIKDPCPAGSIVQEAAQYDVGVVALQGNDNNERYASTSKIFTYMTAGLAVLGSDLPGIAGVIRSAKNGELVPNMTPRLWAKAFDHMAQMNVGTIDTYRTNSLAFAKDRTLDKQKDAFLGVFEKALRERQSRASK